MLCSARIAFFARRSNHRQAPAGLRANPGSGRGETGQRAFCIHRAAAKQEVALTPYGHFTRDGVDVTQQHNFTRSVAH